MAVAVLMRAKERGNRTKCGRAAESVGGTSTNPLAKAKEKANKTKCSSALRSASGAGSSSSGSQVRSSNPLHEENGNEGNNPLYEQEGIAGDGIGGGTGSGMGSLSRYMKAKEKANKTKCRSAGSSSSSVLRDTATDPLDQVDRRTLLHAGVSASV